MDNETFGELLKEFRTRRNLSQVTLAKELAVVRSTVAHWEDDTSKPSGETLLKLAEVLQLSLEEKIELFKKAGKEELVRLVVLESQTPPAKKETVHDTSATPRTVPLRPLPRVLYFTGRGADIKQILKELQPGCVVTLCGPGGVGKTALAAEVVLLLAFGDERPQRFPDGIIFHDFYREREANVALEKVARAFGEEPRPTPAVAAESVLAHRKVLLILDGAENAHGLGNVLAVRGNQCGVLITTTHVHDAEGFLYLLEPLPLVDAKSVLGAWSQGKTVDESTAEEICALVGYLPLALRVAGEFMVQRQMSAAEYLELLKDTELSALHLTDRKHKSLPILLSLSIEPLSKAAREALAVIALLAFSPFQWEVVAAALETSKSATYLLLSELTDYSLLERIAERYQITHRLMHTYARQELRASPESAKRLAEYYTAFAREQQALGPAGYGQLDVERPHILAVLSTCREQNEWGLTKALAWVIDEYLDLQGHWTERVNTLQAGLTAARALNDTQAEGRFLGKLGEVHYQQGRWDEATLLCQESLRILQDLGDAAGKAQILNQLGIIYFNQNRWDEASQSFEDSRRTWRELGNRQGEGKAHNGLCGIYRMLGRWREALEQGQAALLIFQGLGDRLGESRVLNNLGNIYADQGQLADAAQMYKASLLIKQELGDRSGEEMALNNLALVYADQGHWPEAIECYEQALALCRKLGTRQGEDSVLNNLGDIYADQGDWSEAIKLYQESLAIAREMHNRGSEAQTLNNLGMIYADQGRWTEAIALYQESLLIKRELGDHPNEGHTLTNLARVYAEQGNINEAFRLHEESLQIAQELGDRLGEARTLLHLGHVYTKQNSWGNAIKQYNESRKIFRQLGVRHDEGRVLLSLGAADYGQSRLNEAETRYSAALLIFRELGARHDEGIALMKLSLLKERQDEKDNALAYAQEALAKLNPDSPEYKQLAKQFK